MLVAFWLLTALLCRRMMVAGGLDNLGAVHRGNRMLMAIFIMAVGTDFSLVLIGVLLGNEKSNKSTRMRRYCSH